MHENDGLTPLRFLSRMWGRRGRRGALTILDLQSAPDSVAHIQAVTAWAGAESGGLYALLVLQLSFIIVVLFKTKVPRT